MKNGKRKPIRAAAAALTLLLVAALLSGCGSDKEHAGQQRCIAQDAQPCSAAGLYSGSWQTMRRRFSQRRSGMFFKKAFTCSQAQDIVNCHFAICAKKRRYPALGLPET